MSEPSVGYLAYGSNLSSARLRAYIDGAAPDSVWGAHDGCADTAPTPAIAAHWITGRLRFVGHSVRWGGGVGSIDLAATDHEFFAVEYRMSRTQFAHLVRGESSANRMALDWEAMTTHGCCVVGEARYGSVVRPEGQEGFLLTAVAHEVDAAPTDAYVETIRSGLLRWMPESEAQAYLEAAVRP